MTETVYRSTHPDVLAAVAQYRADMADWHERVAVLLAELGFVDRDVLVATAFGHRHITGIEFKTGDTVPDGWRTKTSRGQTRLVARLSTRAGKAVEKRLGEIKPPADVRGALPGMPCDMECGPIPALHEINGAAWVRWPREQKETAVVGDTRAGYVQLRMWERMRLSQFHAAREEQEAADA